jgi:hypothetical protein
VSLNIIQAVSCRFPASAARIRYQVRSCGIYGGQICNEAGYIRVIRVLLPIHTPPNVPHSSVIQIPPVAGVPFELSSTPHP